ncbi:MAG: ATP-binding protein [Acidimicrobiales bacterium]
MTVAYIPRVVDAELDELSAQLPAIMLDGPKGVGKTTTAEQRSSTVFRLDNSETAELVRADPGMIDASGAGTVVIDEWQRVPETWDYIRRACDAGAPSGRYLLTGSAAPEGAHLHSGAGRIVTTRMRPLSFYERHPPEAPVSLAALLNGTCPDLGGSSDVSLADYMDEILAGGFPGLRRYSGRGLTAQLESYIDAIVEKDFTELGHVVRRPATLRGWFRAYAAATATTAAYATILDAATPGESDKPAKTTTIVYRDVLARLRVIEELDAWLPVQNRLHRLTQAPKHHLTDPALAAHLLSVDRGAFLTGSGTDSVQRPKGGSLAGALFESLATQSVRTYAQAADATVSHLRTGGGRREVDIVVERRDGTVLAIEVKLGHSPDTDDVRHLLWLRDEIGDGLCDAIVVTTGRNAYRRSDGIGVIPLALLGP